jgi:hypothetical protein
MKSHIPASIDFEPSIFNLSFVKYDMLFVCEATVEVNVFTSVSFPYVVRAEAVVRYSLPSTVPFALRNSVDNPFVENLEAVIGPQLIAFAPNAKVP